MNEIIKVYKDTYLIKGFGCHCYVLLGTPNIMIDAGCKGDIRYFVEQSLGISITHVINTHAHFDHTGGNGYFDVVYMSEKSAKSAKNYMDEDATNLPMMYDITFVKDQDIIDLNNRRLKVIASDVHAQGSIFLYDMDYHLLFSGDEIDLDQILLLPSFAQKEGQFHSHSASSIERFLEMMTIIQQEYSNVHYIFTGHNTTPLHPTFINECITLGEKILDNYIGSEDCSSDTYSKEASHYPYKDAGYRRATYKHATLVYNQNLLQKSDEATKQPIATPLHYIASKSTKYLNIKTNLKIGITSYGKITKTHLHALQAMKILPHALLTRKTNSEKKQLFQHVYVDTNSFFADKFDIVDVCGANYQHYPYALQAIEKGCAVYLEKPIALNLKEADILFQKSQEYQTLSAVALINRFNPIIVLARDLCKSGKLGNIIHFKAHFYHSSYNTMDKLMTWRQNFSLSGGGAIVDLGIHTIDIIHFLLGNIDSVISTSATIYKNRYTDDTHTTMEENDTDEYTAVLMKTKNNTIGILESSRISHSIHKDPVIEIFGTKGSVIVYEDEIKWLDIENNELHNQDDITPSHFYRYLIDSCLPKTLMNHFETMHYTSLNNFLNMYHKKHFFKETPTIKEAYQAQAVIDAILTSWESKTWEKIKFF